VKKEPHFTPDLFKFFRQLERNNKREWFLKNKDRYVEVARDPMTQFIADLAPGLRRISKNFLADPRPVGGSMFRIYRDVRFARDKRPYKTACTAQFRHRKGKDVHAPGFYVHLGTDGVYAGSGLWRPDAPTTAKVRRFIVDHPARWKRIVRGKKFPPMSGDSLKRPPRGFDAEHPLIEDLKRKDFVTMVELDERTACSPDFLDRYVEMCRTSAPLVRFLTESLELEW
jgi:uncharacterized protein (TIGR02453 family)